MRKVKFIFLFITAISITIFALFLGCENVKNPVHSRFDEEYVMFQCGCDVYRKCVDDTVVKVFVDSPGYQFFRDSKVLRVHFFSLSDSIVEPFKLIVGRTSRMSGDWAGGCGGVCSVNDFPYTYDLSLGPTGINDSFSIRNMDDKGNVLFTFMGDSISLPPDSSWFKSTELWRESDEQGIVMECRNTYTFTNFGFCKKKNIILP
jgi:hypothetical protein